MKGPRKSRVGDGWNTEITGADVLADIQSKLGHMNRISGYNGVFASIFSYLMPRGCCEVCGEVLVMAKSKDQEMFDAFFVLCWKCAAEQKGLFMDPCFSMEWQEKIFHQAYGIEEISTGQGGG